MIIYVRCVHLYFYTATLATFFRLAHGGELCEVSRAWRWPASWGYTGGLGMPKWGYPIDIPGISQRQGANHFRLVFSGYGEFFLLKDL